MIRAALFGAVGAFLLTGGVFADGPSVYAQFLGGGALGGTIDTVIAHVPQDYELSSGYTVAGTLGVVVANGLSVELDVMHVHRDYPAFAGYWWNTTSVMANIKYTLDVNNQVSLYAAAGAGEIFGDDHYDPPDDYYFSGLGYQLIAGAQVAVMKNIGLVGEVRYQDSFAPLQWEFDPADTRFAGTVALLAGIKASY